MVAVPIPPAKSGLGLSPYGDNATIWEIRSNAILTHSGGANYYTGNVFFLGF